MDAFSITNTYPSRNLGSLITGHFSSSEKKSQIAARARVDHPTQRSHVTTAAAAAAAGDVAASRLPPTLRYFSLSTLQ